VHAYLSSIERLPDIYDRLRGVQTEHLDFRKIFKVYDTPNTFFYLDPPYVHSTRKTTNDYEHEMTDQDHEELVERLLRVKGKAMLSGYENPIYERLEQAGWEKHCFEVKLNNVACGSKDTLQSNGSGRRKESRIETIWVNY
jgi:DNA adenine methylase